MKTAIFLIALIISVPTWATLTSGAQECPIQFEGKVKQIIEPVGSSGIFSTNKVVFENERTIKGDVDEIVTLDVLQNGPFHLETEKEYRVHVRSGRICSIDEL